MSKVAAQPQSARKCGFANGAPGTGIPSPCTVSRTDALCLHKGRTDALCKQRPDTEKQYYDHSEYNPVISENFKVMIPYVFH